LRFCQISDKGVEATEDAIARFLSRDGTRTTSNILSSPLEMQGGLLSTAYHFMLFQSQSILHYYETNMQYLEDVYGPELNRSIIADHFELNPFLEDAQYQQLVAKMVDDHHQNYPNLRELSQKEIDDLPSSSKGVYDEPITLPTEEQVRVLQRTGNSDDWEEFNKELDKLNEEKKQLEERDVNTLKN